MSASDLVASPHASRNYCFTLNNPTPEEDPKTWGTKFLVYQLERSDSGTPHYQGYCTFSCVKRLSALKKLNPRAAWFARRGTHEEALHYCTKPVSGCSCKHCVPIPVRLDGPWIIGEPPAQGQRSDLMEVKEKIDTGCTLDDLWQDHFSTMVHLNKGLSQYIDSKQKHRSSKTVVAVHWGPPGIGKTTRVSQTAGRDVYWKDSDNSWFEGYENQKHVVFDEFNGKWFTYSYLKRILDFTPIRVPIKGRSAKFNSKYIHITSNLDPSMWYNNQKYPWMELHRRLDICYRYSGSVGSDPSIEWDHMAVPPICSEHMCPVMHAYNHDSGPFDVPSTPPTDDEEIEPRHIKTATGFMIPNPKYKK